VTARVEKRKAPVRPVRKDRAWPLRAEWGLAILLVGVSLYLHFIFLRNVGGLWRDEVHSVQMASLPSVSSAFHALRYDSFPLLSTVVLGGWIHAGLGSDQGLRIFGFLVGALFLGALWLTSRLMGSPTPVLSLALVGLNPWVIRTVDSVRPYGIGIALVVATLGCVWKAVETPGWKWLALAALPAVLCVQCMYQNAFLLLAICVGGVVVSLRASRIRKAMGVVLIGLAAAVSLVPYLPSVAAAQTWGILVRSPITWQRLFDELFQALGAGHASTLWLWFGLAILSLAVGIQALVSRKGKTAARARADLGLYCAAVLLTAVAVYLVAIKASQLLTQPWYFAPLAALIAPTLDASARLAATTDGRRVARLVAVSAVACTTAIPGWQLSRARWTNVDVVAARVGAQAAAGDAIVLNPFWIGITFQRYYKGPAKWVTIPPLEDVHIVRFDLVKAAMARSGALDPALETMAKALQSGHRVFWVQGLAVNENEPPRRLPPAPLPDTGWYLGPYLFDWARQASYFLQSHGLRSEIMDTRVAGSALGYEVVVVTIISGWH